MDEVFKIDNCAAILLAAGASVRLATPKQLLPYKGKSLLQNMVSVAINSRLHPIILVLGAHANLIRGEVNDHNVHVVYNQDWQEGIASSLRFGVRTVEEIDPACDAAIVMVCDQPHITPAVIDELLTAQKTTGKPMVGSRYSGVTGTPALFHKTFFPELLLLQGDKGAGKILREQIDQVATISFPLGAIDIDTIDDYEKLKLDV